MDKQLNMDNELNMNKELNAVKDTKENKKESKKESKKDYTSLRFKMFRFKVKSVEMASIIEVAKLHKINASSFIRCVLFKYYEELINSDNEELKHELIQKVIDNIEKEDDYYKFKQLL